MQVTSQSQSINFSCYCTSSCLHARQVRMPCCPCAHLHALLLLCCLAQVIQQVVCQRSSHRLWQSMPLAEGPGCILWFISLAKFNLSTATSPNIDSGDEHHCTSVLQHGLCEVAANPNTQGAHQLRKLLFIGCLSCCITLLQRSFKLTRPGWDLHFCSDQSGLTLRSSRVHHHVVLNHICFN
jgi:hypothetical protein